MKMKTTKYPTVTIKKGRDKAILRRHPWVYASAIRAVQEHIEPGMMVRVHDVHGDFLAYGSYSPDSQIRVRLWSWDVAVKPENDFLYDRMKEAFEYRDRFIDKSTTNAYRLVHAESDGIPGLVVDRYNQFCVIQFLSTGSERLRDEICDMVHQLSQGASIYERSDVNVRKLEGLPPKSGVLIGERPPSTIEILENGLRFNVDIVRGQKTGFYLDQRHNRELVRDFANDRHVLNCFAYSGAFSIYALDGGAAGVTSIESSTSAIDMAKKHVDLNGYNETKAEWLEGDVFEILREFRDRGENFDTIVLDPPKFAHNVSQVERAARAYKDVNLLAFKLLNHGGTLFTFSCSGSVTKALFHKIVADAALDAGVRARIVSWMSQGPDHPVSTNFPEGEYLKGMILAVS